MDVTLSLNYRDVCVLNSSTSTTTATPVMSTSCDDGEAAAMEVRSRVLGYYGRNHDQRTCVYQRGAIDEISHDGTGTCERAPAFIIRSIRVVSILQFLLFQN